MADKGKFTVVYFKAKGRAEAARWILAYGKADFEDESFDDDEWPAFKPHQPLQQVPVLRWTDGSQKLTLCQSAAIYRFLADIFGLAGKNPIQAAKAHETAEMIKEVQDALTTAMFDEDKEHQKKLYHNLFSEHLPRVFTFLEKRAKENGGKNLAGGDGYTYADIVLGCFIDMVKDIPGMDFSPYTTLKALAKAVAEIDGIKAHIAKRPKTDY